MGPRRSGNHAVRPPLIAALTRCRSSHALFHLPVSEAAHAERIAICDHLEEALALEKSLRHPSGATDACDIRMIEADSETHARELLFHVRSPEEGLIGDA